MKEISTWIAIAGTPCAFLPGVPLQASIRATTRLEEIAGADAVLMVPPAQHLRAVAGRLATTLPDGKPVVICAKGIEQALSASIRFEETSRTQEGAVRELAAALDRPGRLL